MLSRFESDTEYMAEYYHECVPAILEHSLPPPLIRIVLSLVLPESIEQFLKL